MVLVLRKYFRPITKCCLQNTSRKALKQKLQISLKLCELTSLFLLILNKVLSSGRQKWLELLESISAREEAVAGGVAIAAAFASYLGPYTFKFRREMLTEHWPRCLNERGVKLVVDSSTVYASVPMVMDDQDDTERTSPDNEEVRKNASQGYPTAQNGRTNQCFSLHLLTNLRLSALLLYILLLSMKLFV